MMQAGGIGEFAVLTSLISLAIDPTAMFQPYNVWQSKWSLFNSRYAMEKGYLATQSVDD